MSGKLSIALCSGASLLAMATSALAQQSPAAPSASPAPDSVQTVVVTGSRIVRNGYAAPSPVTVATTAELAATTPSSIPDGLNKLPAFAGSSTTAGTTNAVGGSGGGVAVTFGGNYLNLRDMGAIRTLVLVDGRRVPPTSLNGQVDTNTLPDMLVQRVDVVTGGASAVYGSDAVTGVVNFILDKNFNGLKVFGQVGDSTYGDARSYRFGVAGGGEIMDRAHVIWSFEEYQNNGIDSHASRPWAANIPDYTGSGTVASPFTLVTNARLNNTTLGGLATSGPFAGQQFTSSGALAAFNAGAPTKTSSVNIGGDGAYYTGLNLVPPLTTEKGFGRFDYDVTSTVKAYLQFSDSESKIDDS
jgi:iron complex outermembrane receptor protein